MTTAREPLIALFGLGAATVVAQSVLVREGMSAFAGSELAWALVFSAWLAGVALGSRVAAVRPVAHWAEALPIAVLLLAGGGVIVLRAIPMLAGATAGETAPAWRAFWAWPVAVIPAALVGGMAFPWLAAGLERSIPARAYAAEAAGALAGGLAFTFLLAGHGSAVALLWTAGVVAASSLRGRPGLAVAVFLGALALGGPAGRGLEALSWRWSGHPGRLEAWAETRRQRLELTAGSPHALYADGRLLASWPDPWGSGTRAHLLMLLHEHPRRVLAVGALADGTATVLLEHSPDRLDLVEEDPALFRILPAWYGAPLVRTLADPRTHAMAEDPLQAVRHGGPWDLVLLLDPDPVSLRRNRTRTVEFFQALREHLAPGGRVVVATSVPDTYLGGVGGRLLEVLSDTLRAVFPAVAGLPGEHVVLVAGDGLSDLRHPEILKARWRRLGMEDPVFGPELIPVLLDPVRARALNRFLERTGATADRMARPSAVLPAMALAEGRGVPRLASLLESLGRLGREAAGVIVVLLAFGLGAVALRSRRAAGEAAVFTLGMVSMGAFVLLLGAWQSTRGDVYSEIGFLTAGFMGGIAAGAMVGASDRGRRFHPGWSLSGLAILLLALALTLPFGAPWAIPLLLVLGGTLTGLSFPSATALTGEGGPAAGRGFAADEAGAAAGALLCGILLPLTGTTFLAVALAGLVVAVLPGLWRYGRKD